MQFAKTIAGYLGQSEKGVTSDDVNALYDAPRSFTDYLPWVDYLPESNTFLLDDGVSVGAMFEITSISTEGKTHKYLSEIEENIRSVLVHSIPQRDDPYIVQIYVQDEQSLSQYREDYSNYIPEEIRQTEFTKDFISHYDAHLRRVENPKGFFEDTGVTGGLWSGKIRRVRAFIYRRVNPANVDNRRQDLSEEEQVNEISDKFVSQLKAGGIGVRRCCGEDFWYWMLEWLNPNPSATGGDIEKLRKLMPYPGHEDLPYGADFAKALTITQPESKSGIGCWKFDDVLHKAITIENLIRTPKPGHLTGERKIGENLYAVFDRMPIGSILGFTIVIQPQDMVTNKVSAIKHAAKGDDADAEMTHADAERALQLISNGNSMYPVIMTVFVKGTSELDVRRKVTSAHSLLLANGIHAIDESDDQVPLDSYIKLMPMNYEPSREKKVKSSRYMFTSHLARLLPFFGRERGTGNPGLAFFNRGGEPVTFDPLNKNDRSKNAFGLVLGPPGSGKSALMVYILMLFIARYRPRVFIIEKGGSFSLFGKYCKSLGLTVNQKILHPKMDVRLPPFADAIKLLVREEKKERALRSELEVDEFVREDVDDEDSEEELLSDEGDDDEVERDYLGEMELSARVMITGGDKREEEKMSRSDRLLIRKAIVNAAIAKRDTNLASGKGEMVLTEDVVFALKQIGQEKDRREASVDRAHDMAEAMELFTDGTNGHFFNRPGDMWPECDVTIMEMGILANEGYEDGMALGFMSLMNIITAIVERDQFEGRPTIILGDEAHLFTTNPLLAPFIVKIVKMYRKLGAWLWLATQNLEDFPKESRKMLSMFEWFIAMTCPKEQVELIAEFRDLTVEQKSMLLASHKEPKKYTEGVVCSPKITALFRNVPPPIALALAMTEKDEKAERNAIMKANNCTELEAAFQIAKTIGTARESGVAY